MEARVRRTLTQALHSDVSQENITEVTFFFLLPDSATADRCQHGVDGISAGKTAWDTVTDRPDKHERAEQQAAKNWTTEVPGADKES